jgi:hypothetical protein
MESLRYVGCFFILFLIKLSLFGQAVTEEKNKAHTATDAAQQLLYAVRLGEFTDSLTAQLSKLPMSVLKQELSNDAARKAFWINLYNAYTQILLRNNPDAYKNRSAFFSVRKIRAAGHWFSLDEIEHGILRRSQLKWGLGYIRNPLASKLEKELRVDTPDYRIHFALNCGAASCPPISYYKPESIDQQLDLATRVYLQSETSIDSVAGKIYVPKILSWFRGDFGGKRGIKELLRQLSLIPAHQTFALRFKPYDWTLALRRFA